jgi:hypothetical protein
VSAPAFRRDRSYGPPPVPDRRVIHVDFGLASAFEEGQRAAEVYPYAQTCPYLGARAEAWARGYTSRCQHDPHPAGKGWERCCRCGSVRKTA